MTGSPRTPEASQDPSAHASLPVWVKALVFGVLLMVGLWGFHYLELRLRLQTLLDAIADMGLWAPVLFILLYVLATVVLIPGSVLTLGAGAVFGVAKGSVIVLIGATLGATAAFLVGRYLARDWVAGRIERHPRFREIDRAVAEGGWKIVGLTRLSPLFPFTFLNYAFGLTRVSLKQYFFASLVGMAPGTVMYVYLGALAHAGIERDGRTVGQWALLIAGLMATVAVTVVVTRMARRALNRKIESE